MRMKTKKAVAALLLEMSLSIYSNWSCVVMEGKVRPLLPAPILTALLRYQELYGCHSRFQAYIVLKPFSPCQLWFCILKIILVPKTYWLFFHHRSIHVLCIINSCTIFPEIYSLELGRPTVLLDAGVSKLVCHRLLLTLQFDVRTRFRIPCRNIVMVNWALASVFLFICLIAFGAFGLGNTTTCYRHYPFTL